MAVAYSYMGIPQYQGQGPHSCDKTLSGLFTDPIPEMTGLCLAVAIQTNVSLDSIDQQTYSVSAFQKVSTESFMVEVGKTNIVLVCEQPAD